MGSEYFTAVPEVGFSHNSFSGQINITGHTPQAAVGGIWGQMQSDVPLEISNNFANAQITNTATVDAYFLLAGFSGAFDANAPLTISNSYTAGNISVSGDALDAAQGGIGGFAGIVSSEIHDDHQFVTFTNDFSHTVLDLPNGSQTFRAGFFVVDPSPPTINDLSSAYFDADLANSTDCSFDHSQDTCVPVSGQPDYFYNNHTNLPLSNWDFTNIWKTTSTLPIFAEAVTNSISPIPASRLTPRPQTPHATSSSSPTTPLLPDLLSGLQFARGSGLTNTNKPSSESTGGLIGNIKNLLRHIPAKVLTSFPYVLFGLLLAGTVAMLIEMLQQARRLKQLRLLIAKQASIAEERDTFWHLAANYLRAPITLLMGGTDLLSTGKAPSKTAQSITKLTASMQTKVASIMEQIEHSKSLQDIKWPKLETGQQVLRSLRFWLPVASVGGLSMLADYLAHNFRHLPVGTLTLLSQIIVFFLVSVVLYWVVGALGVAKNKRRQAETMLARQRRDLDSARSALIKKTAEVLDEDVEQLEVLLSKLPDNEPTQPIFHEGARRIRQMVDSFQLLITAQNHKLGSISSPQATTDITRLTSSSLQELQPEITTKKLVVKTPSTTNLWVPGDKKLIKQVVDSVLANAIGFSPIGGKVSVKIQTAGEHIVMTVSDSGPGVSKEQLGHIFQPFTKADGQDALQLDHGGLGISLYIDQQVMDYLGGDITIDTAQNKGATVTVRWPRLAPGASASSKIPTAEQSYAT
jgi:signal transduction histidine kinase